MEEKTKRTKGTTPPPFRRSMGNEARLSGRQRGEGVRKQENETIRGNVTSRDAGGQDEHADDHILHTRAVSHSDETTLTLVSVLMMAAR